MYSLYIYISVIAIVHGCGCSHDFDSLKSVTTKGWFEKGGALFEALCSGKDCRLDFCVSDFGEPYRAHVCSAVKMQKTESDCLFALCRTCYAFKYMYSTQCLKHRFNMISQLGGCNRIKINTFYGNQLYLYTQSRLILSVYMYAVYLYRRHGVNGREIMITTYLLN